MKAIRVEALGGPEVLQIREVAALTPNAGEVLVHLRAAGVNPVETYMRAGAQGYQPTLPYTPGSDGAGTVAAVGAGVADVCAGQRIYVAGSITGTYAESCLCRPSQVFALPSSLSFAQGAALGIPYSTAYRALFQRTQVKSSDRVLIHGASGGVGLAAVQLCVARGIAVTGTAGSEAGCQLVRAAGAVSVVNHTKRNEEAYVAELLELTAGRGFDVIVEMLANVNLAADLGLLAKFGRVVIVGNRGTIAINPRDTMTHDASILGVSMMNATEEEKRAIHGALAPLLEAGKLAPVIQAELTLDRAPDAHRMVLERPSLGKIVLLPS